MRAILALSSRRQKLVLLERMSQNVETFLSLFPITCLLLSALRLTDATMLMATIFVISTSTYHQVCGGGACDVQLMCDVAALGLLHRWLLVFGFAVEVV